MKTRRLTATHRPYAVVVVYQDPDKRPTWHETRRAAERAASLHLGTIVRCEET